MTDDQEAPPQRVKFELGRVVMTANAHSALGEADIRHGLLRHARGDWGECVAEDWQANDKALVDGSRIFSVYHGQDGTKFWIITQAKASADSPRESTCLLLPEDY